MEDLGWIAKSAALPRKGEVIDGLRDDFGIRVQSVVQALREKGTDGPKKSLQASKGKIHLQQNKGVSQRAKNDFDMQETDESKERKRLESLERKAQIYEELQARVNLDDEAANDLHEVDFIAKALAEDRIPDSTAPMSASLHPEEILRRQAEIRLQMQGGQSQREEYSTYDQDKAELEARHRRVDETDELNEQRQAEFDELKRKRENQARHKQKEAAKQKQDILKRLLLKKQRRK